MEINIHSIQGFVRKDKLPKEEKESAMGTKAQWMAHKKELVSARIS